MSDRFDGTSDSPHGNSERRRWLKSRGEFFASVHSRQSGTFAAFLDNIVLVPRTTVKKASICPVDTDSPAVNVRNGERRTTDQPAGRRQTIHLLGPSVVFSYPVPDDATIASCLQRRLGGPASAYRVCNHGTFGDHLANVYLRFRALDPDAGDIVFAHAIRPLEEKSGGSHSVDFALRINEECQSRGVSFFMVFFPRIELIANPSQMEQSIARLTYGELLSGKRIRADATPADGNRPAPPFMKELLAAGCSCIDAQPYFDRPHELGEIFADKIHFGPAGYRRMGDILYDAIVKIPRPAGKNSNEISRVPPPAQGSCLKRAVNFLKWAVREEHRDNRVLHDWLDSLPRPPSPPSPVIGAVVMHCSPFTLGHRHLLETALRGTDLLYLFLVEDERSRFPFADRLALARQGASCFGGRVLVVPGGRFIVSSRTFPEYFDKDSIPDEIDASNDVGIFGAIVCERLGIRRRFLGEEPFCPVTAEYNREIARFLPLMGIDVAIVPRKTAGTGAGRPISASLVRELTDAEDWAALAELVPGTTLAYLRETAATGGRK